MKNNILRFLIVTLLFISAGSPGNCQYKILESKGAVEQVQQTIDSIYNLNFDAADIMIADLEKKLGDYPGLLLLKAFYLSWKFRPIRLEHASYSLFENYLKQGIDKSEALLNENSENIEANFFLMACHSFLAELYVGNGQNFKALGEAQSAYKHIKVGFDYVDEYPEFNFSSGIFNYYREKYPEENPFYKSVTWFFRSGDKKEGLSMLKKGSQLAVFTKAECLTYLFHIYLRYENEPQSAIYYAHILIDKYPNNLHYISNFVENSIRLGKIGEIKPYILRLTESEQPYYQYLGEIFYGAYIVEKEESLNEALTHLRKANKLGDQDNIRMTHYDSILFYEFGIINKKLGNIELANDYLKKSIKSAEYKSYRDDAEALLEK